MNDELFDLLWQAGYSPVRRGASLFMLCPFHNDADPSLGIKDNRWHCFGCHKSGTVDYLLEELGIKERPESDILQIETERVISLIANRLGELEGLPKDFKLFSKKFRNINKQVLDEFECGVSELYQDELIFPIYSEQGTLAGFIRHKPNEKYKYNYFNGYLPYNLNRVVPTNLLLVEGIFDLLSVYQAGHQNVLALLGTGNVWKVVQYLRKIKAKNVKILFDGDNAGITAAKKMHDLYPQSTILRMPEGQDPNSIKQDKLERIIKQ